MPKWAFSMPHCSLMSMGTPLFYFKIKVTNDKIVSGQSLNKNLLSLLFQRNYLKMLTCSLIPNFNYNNWSQRPIKTIVLEIRPIGKRFWMNVRDNDRCELHPPSSSSTRPCSTTEPNKSTEHSAIQSKAPSSYLMVCGN